MRRFPHSPQLHDRKEIKKDEKKIKEIINWKTVLSLKTLFFISGSLAILKLMWPITEAIMAVYAVMFIAFWIAGVWICADVCKLVLSLEKVQALLKKVRKTNGGKAGNGKAGGSKVVEKKSVEYYLEEGRKRSGYSAWYCGRW